MENNKREEAALNDELLDKVSGGSDDYDYCEWSSAGKHEWEDYKDANGQYRRRCKRCGIRLY